MRFEGGVVWIAFILYLLVRFCVELHDIWVSGVSRVTFSWILDAMGVPGVAWDVQCQLLINLGWLWYSKWEPLVP